MRPHVVLSKGPFPQFPRSDGGWCPARVVEGRLEWTSLIVIKEKEIPGEDETEITGEAYE